MTWNHFGALEFQKSPKLNAYKISFSFFHCHLGLFVLNSNSMRKKIYSNYWLCELNGLFALHASSINPKVLLSANLLNKRKHLFQSINFFNCFTAKSYEELMITNREWKENKIWNNWVVPFMFFYFHFSSRGSKHRRETSQRDEKLGRQNYYFNILNRISRVSSSFLDSWTSGGKFIVQICRTLSRPMCWSSFQNDKKLCRLHTHVDRFFGPS